MTTPAENELFSLLSGEASDGPCRDISDSPCRQELGNFARHVAALSASKVADGLVDPKIVLTWLLTVLGAKTVVKYRRGTGWR